MHIMEHRDQPGQAFTSKKGRLGQGSQYLCEQILKLRSSTEYQFAQKNILVFDTDEHSPLFKLILKGCPCTYLHLLRVTFNVQTNVFCIYNLNHIQRVKAGIKQIGTNKTYWWCETLAAEHSMKANNSTSVAVTKTI